MLTILNCKQTNNCVVRVSNGFTNFLLLRIYGGLKYALRKMCEVFQGQEVQCLYSLRYVLEIYDYNILVNRQYGGVEVA